MLAKRTICRLLIVSILLLPATPARAGMISADAAMALDGQSTQRALVALLNRPDVARELEAFGVERKAAQDRIAAMTDAEARAVADQLQQLPAGGDYGAGGGGAGLGTVLLVVLLVVLIIVLLQSRR